MWQLKFMETFPFDHEIFTDHRETEYLYIVGF